MSWHYLPELVGVSSEVISLVGGPSAPWKRTAIVERCSSDDNGTVCCHCSRSGMISRHSTGSHGVEKWISSLEGSHVKTSRAQVEETESPENDLDFGSKWQESSVKYDLNSCMWKTHRCLFIEDLQSSLVTLPQWGMMQDGVLYRRKTAKRPIDGTGSGYLPTPSAVSYGTNQGGSAGRVGKVRPSLQTMAKQRLWPTPRTAGLDGGSNSRKAAKARGMWPTPTQSDGQGGPGQGKKCQGGQDLQTVVQLFPTPTSNRRTGLQSHGVNVVTGQLNPTWVEWLMGWPIGWTDLEPLAMDRFQEWLRQHGEF
jgi:hypothetical protein